MLPFLVIIQGCCLLFAWLIDSDEVEQSQHLCDKQLMLIIVMWCFRLGNMFLKFGTHGQHSPFCIHHKLFPIQNCYAVLRDVGWFTYWLQSREEGVHPSSMFCSWRMAWVAILWYPHRLVLVNYWRCYLWPCSSVIWTSCSLRQGCAAQFTDFMGCSNISLLHPWGRLLNFLCPIAM